jgi:very-short-patch-repair endonuclease
VCSGKPKITCETNPPAEEGREREKALQELGLRIVCFRNDDVLKDAERSAVAGKIKGLILEHDLGDALTNKG